MKIHEFKWDELFKDAEEFIHKYVPEAKVNTGIMTCCKGIASVDVSFPLKGNRKQLETLLSLPCCSTGRGSNVNGVRIAHVSIHFDESGNLIK